jgi:hypothetical protein
MPKQKIVDSSGNAVTGLGLHPVADDEVNTQTEISGDDNASPEESENAASSSVMISSGGFALGISAILIHL